MPESVTAFDVREVADGVRAIDVKGDITAASEDVLMDAYGRANESSPKAIVLNFSGLDYMNSGGIGLLVTLLVRAQRQGQDVLAYRPLRPLPPDLRVDAPRRGRGHARFRGRRGGRGRRVFREETMSNESDQQQGPGDTMPEESEEEAAAREATGWAKSVSRLNVSEVPEGAVNINVEGRRLASPIQGFGRMWQKTYQVRIPAERVPSDDLIATWKREFPEFWPEGNNFYAPLTGIEPGDVALLNMTLPGKMKLSTGVMVLYADAESFTLMTPEGHMFAGWITFSAIESEGDTVAQAQVLMRASDPIFEMGLTMGGHKQEDRFWNSTLTALAARFDCDAEVDTQVVCVDKKRQWSKWRNVWHSSAIRSTLYMLAAPWRALKRLFGRERTVA